MNGEKSSPLDERIQKIQEIANEYGEKNSLPINRPPCTKDELERYLYMSRTELDALSQNESVQLCILLSQYDLFLQRLINRKRALINWLKTELNRTVAQTYNKFRGSWEMQMQQAINNNEYATAVQRKLLEFETLLLDLENLTYSLNSFQKQITSSRYLKNNKNENN